VTPGAYFLTASVNDGSNYRQGRLAVDVGSSTIEGLIVTVAPGVSVRGHVRSDPDGPPVDLSSVRFMLQPRELNIYGGGGQAKPEPDGTFEMKNVTADRFNLVSYNLPAGAYIKSVRCDQTDVLASGLDLTAGAPPALLEIVVSPRAANVAGTVQNAKTGNTAPGAMVVLVPQEKERREQQSYYKQMVSDQLGAFSLAGVPPGEYKVYAWEDIESGAWMDPDVLKVVEDKGESLTLREGDQKSLTLKLIPADGGAN
jgi:Carboxypeptidase regulatory-like domain